MVLKRFLDCMVDSQGDSGPLGELLKKCPVDINAYDTSGFTLLHHAARLGYDDCIYVLFQCGANHDQLNMVDGKKLPSF